VAEAKDGGYRLINTDELRQRYEKDPRSILLVDTRQEWEFALGHMQGAVNFPMEPTAWSRWWKKGDLAATLGPDKNRFIVFY
jgi:predicted sulfurtransferase